MTNIAYQDRAGGQVHVYTANKELPRLKRIKVALKELEHTGMIKIYLYKKRKLTLIKTKGL